MKKVLTHQHLKYNLEYVPLQNNAMYKTDFSVTY